MVKKIGLWLLVCLCPATWADEREHSGQLMLEGAGQAMHLSSHYRLQIQGLAARVELTQTFKNTSQEWVNATYVFPLPEDSAVSRLTMTVGKRVIEGEIQEKQQARQTFEAAKRAGKKATLIEQQRPNLFRQQLANVGPGETVKIILGYNQQVIYDAGEFRLRLPTTLTPRYIPGISHAEFQPEGEVQTGASGWALPTAEVPDAPQITPPQWHSPAGEILNPMTLDVHLDAGMPLAQVGSATHKLAVQTPQGAPLQREISLAAGKVEMDRDLELSWRAQPGKSPVAAQFVTQWQGDRYAQILLMPPQQLDSEQVLPRELILVVDTSGSMGGTSIEQARASALMALQQLAEGDRFNLLFFASDTRAVFPQAVVASADNKAIARQALQKMRAGGGTEMHGALARAFAHKAPESHLQQVVFVTDGSVGNESQLLNLIHRELGQARLFTVAIGSAPNRFFMRRAAEFGRGSFTEIATAEQVQARMQPLLSKLQKPVVSNVRIDWPQPVQAFPRQVPDLYWGEPVQVIAKLPPWPSRSDARVVVSGESAGLRWRRELVLGMPSDAEQTGVPVLAQRFGRAQIAFLEDEAYRAGDSESSRAEILPVALNYQLMSRYTSLVAVDKTPTRPESQAARDTAVANAMPAGSQMRAVGYPQTAAGTLWHWLLGALALIGLLAVQYRGGRHAG
ncbi:marine proteobacterial sortase target protein [Gilvimarinus xylanilyticus]|uniref:Marine proteobacterial sortase target protein n=1 Tax=Gilvimarinus xylanilyticus TaxID=2944139 RepID=A0A9X2HW65_9GAMM|nr:marine proteobacterial sortase target protein [Gilvimarinus xylanilyticus]MCP8899523.1 marine proteobacterial sortase target protein [Gilvimarinus xylanilyticus]